MEKRQTDGRTDTTRRTEAGLRFGSGAAEGFSVDAHRVGARKQAE